jgi:hypothetical protein
MATYFTRIPPTPAGSENTINTYNDLDYVPKGRDEGDLPFHHVLGPPSRSLCGWPLSRCGPAVLARGSTLRERGMSIENKTS